MISQEFFFIESNTPHPIAPLGQGPRLIGKWTSGESLDITVEERLVYNLDLQDIFDASPEEREDRDLSNFGPDDYNTMALVESQSPPLIRNDLLAVIQSAGVQNLQLFEAMVCNPISGKEHAYSAFNIVGVADFDWARDLRCQINQREYRINTPPFLIFRLYDDGPIVVYDSVRLAVEAAKITDVEFIPTYERR